MMLLTNVAKTQDVPLDGTIFFGNTGQKDTVVLSLQKPTEIKFRSTIKNPRMIYLLTNVAKTQDVPLDGTIFFGNTGQKDKATFMNKNVPTELS